MNPLWAAAIPGVVAFALWALLDLDRFLSVAVLGTIMFPNTLISPGGTQVALADMLLVVVVSAWLVRNSLRLAPDPWVLGNRLFVPGLMFVGVNVASLAWSRDPHSTLVFTVQLIGIVLVFPLVFASLPRAIATLRQGLGVFVLMTSLIAIRAAIDFLPRAFGGHAEGTYVLGLHKNVLGSFTGAGLVIAFAFWISARPPRARWALPLAMILETLGLYSSVSRGAIVGTLLGMVAVSTALGRRRWLTAGLVASGVLIFLVAIGPQSARKVDVAGAYDSSVVRQYSFSHATKKINEHPILGTGAATYRDRIEELRIGLPDPNNMFLLTWAEVGIPGLAALLFLLFRYGQLFVRISRLPDETAVVAVAAGGVALSLLAHFQIDVTWTRGTTSLAFAMMGVMLAAQRLSPAPVPAPQIAPMASDEKLRHLSGVT